jgi:glutamate racemase
VKADAQSHGPIAVLDSGLGGLTVVEALRRTLPGEDLIYFGDTAHLPYGNKSAPTVIRFVRRIIRFLLPRRPRHVVIACNTATALALPAIRAQFPDLSISGVIDPGARAAVAAAGAKPVPLIGVIATEATIRSKAYERAILRRRSLARVLLRPAPLLVPMIEEGRGGDDPLVQQVLRQYLQSMVSRGIDVLVLGCTHYPLIRDAIANVLGGKICLIDSAQQCAQDVAQRLGREVSVDGDVRRAWTGSGSLHSFVTDDAWRFTTLASRFLGMQIDPPTLVEPPQLDAGDADEAVETAGALRAIA